MLCQTEIFLHPRAREFHPVKSEASVSLYLSLKPQLKHTGLHISCHALRCTMLSQDFPFQTHFQRSCFNRVSWVVAGIIRIVKSCYLTNFI